MTKLKDFSEDAPRHIVEAAVSDVARALCGFEVEKSPYGRVRIDEFRAGKPRY